MKFKTLTGAERKIIGINKYLISWGSKSKSKFQKSVKDFLEPYWNRHVVFEEFPVAGTRMTFDFYNANKKIAVEVQGAQHTKFVKFFHKNRLKYSDQLKRDQKKFDFCRANSIKLAEVYPQDEIVASLFKKQDIYL